ncbi:MAG: gliding motility-associated C-terminal domain-containing protein, partial [Ferruginibacter sp.]|nr:gliding motility-associated C-terminal domain-containing protein [Cytophagales bacterium]
MQPTPCGERIQMPNAFTPNGDGLNDAFRPVLVAYNTYLLRVFNRWGQEVFRSENPEKGWDGKRNDGKLFGEDTYVYKIIYTCRPNQTQT